MNKSNAMEQGYLWNFFIFTDKIAKMDINHKRGDKNNKRVDKIAKEEIK